jgi:uncharacterized protein YrzB (UPF0473 family)
MSEHKHSENCGCGHDHECDTITLYLDDDTKLNCIVIDIFSVNDKEYIALQPEEGEKDDDNVFFYRFIQEDENEEPQLLNIEDDDEFDAVLDAFEEMLDSLEYDDMFEDEQNE